MAGATAAVWNVEPPVEARQSVGIDDNELDDVVEAVVAGPVMNPSGIVGRALDEAGAGAEASTKRQQTGGEDQEGQLGAHAALAELVEGRAARQKQRGSGDGERQEGQGGEVDAGGALDVAQLETYAHVEGVVGVDAGDDDHDEAGDDARVQKLEEPRGGPAPANVRVVGPGDALHKDEVHDEEEQDAGVGEDVGGDDDAHVVVVARPGDAQAVGDDAGHAEAEEQRRQDKLVRAATVDLENGHVDGGGRREETDEHAADGVVNVGDGHTTDHGHLGHVGRALSRNSVLVLPMSCHVEREKDVLVLLPLVWPFGLAVKPLSPTDVKRWK